VENHKDTIECIACTQRALLENLLYISRAHKSAILARAQRSSTSQGVGVPVPTAGWQRCCWPRPSSTQRDLPPQHISSGQRKPACWQAVYQGGACTLQKLLYTSLKALLSHCNVQSHNPKVAHHRQRCCRPSLVGRRLRVLCARPGAEAMWTAAHPASCALGRAGHCGRGKRVKDLHAGIALHAADTVQAAAT